MRRPRRGVFLPAALAAILVVAGAATVAQAAEPGGRCVTRQQQRTMAAAHTVTPLAQVMRKVKKRYGGEVLRARLCEKDEKLVYLLTVLARDGKVVRASVDASSGKIAGTP